MKTFLRFCVPLLLVTMACAFAQNTLFPPTPEAPAPAEKLRPAASPTPLPATAVHAVTAEAVGNPKPISCDDDDCLDACLERLKTVLKTNPLEPIGNETYEKQHAEIDLVLYPVEGDEIGEPQNLYVPAVYRKYQENTAAHLRIWNFFAAVIPAELRTTIKTFIVFTDGPEGTTAWVSRASTAEDYSQVGVDLLDSERPVFLADTLIHETAHLIFLNSSQVPHDDDHLHYYDETTDRFFECDQYVADGDCSLPDSYINLFYQRFWKSIYPEWWQADLLARYAGSTDEYWEVMEDFYTEHDDEFLDSYAASHLEEDMAGSFAYFVLNRKPAGDAVYEQKALFYYEFPALVEYRRQMIEGLCSYISE